MNVDFTQITMSDKDYFKFADMIYKLCGISLGDNKKELVKARLLKRMRALGLVDFAKYYNYVNDPGHTEELIEIANAVSTNVTYFFREEQHFAFLKNVLPELIRKRTQAGEKIFRIWSAAASSGEEIYTILMVLFEAAPELLNWDVRILGTDISTKALHAAHAGVYSKERLQNVPALLRGKYFSSDGCKDGFYRVVPALSSRSVFRRLNLMRPQFPFKKKFDFVFCRNVMIYFDKPTQETLVRKMKQYIVDGGYLFIGHAESLINVDVDLKRVSSSVYQKVKI